MLKPSPLEVARAELSKHDELLLIKQWLAENGHEAAVESFITEWIKETT